MSNSWWTTADINVNVTRLFVQTFKGGLTATRRADDQRFVNGRPPPVSLYLYHYSEPFREKNPTQPHRSTHTIPQRASKRLAKIKLAIVMIITHSVPIRPLVDVFMNMPVC